MKSFLHLRSSTSRQERFIALDQICWVEVTRNTPRSLPEVDVTFHGGAVLRLDGNEGEELLAALTSRLPVSGALGLPSARPGTAGR